MQVIGVDGIEVLQRDLEPPGACLFGGYERKCVTKRLDHGERCVSSASVKKETKKFTEDCLAGLRRAQELRPTIVGGTQRTVEATDPPGARS